MLGPERDIEAASRGLWRLPGAGLSPGAFVISLSHNGEWKEEVEMRAAALRSPRPHWERLLHLPT